MVEQVARAIDRQAFYAWDKHGRDTNARQCAFAQARAAIEAMSEPTEAMVLDGHAETPYCNGADPHGIIGDRSCNEAITDVWQAMIRAALKEDSEAHQTDTE